jgi:hypothetical protein
MEYWKTQMFNIDMILALQGYGWKPTQVFKYYNSEKFIKDYKQPKECYTYIKTKLSEMEKVREINKEMTINYALNINDKRVNNGKILTNANNENEKECSPKQEPARPQREVMIKSSEKKLEGDLQSVSMTGTTQVTVQEEKQAKNKEVNNENEINALIEQNRLMWKQYEQGDSTKEVTKVETFDVSFSNDFKPEDFISIDAYYDYKEYGDLSGLIKQKDKTMVTISRELQREENLKNNDEAWISKCINENRQHWEKLNNDIEKAKFKKENKKHVQKTAIDISKELGVPYFDMKVYEAESKFPLTSMLQQYDSYTDEEIDAITDDKKRHKAYWQKSSVGFANLLLERSITMLSQINNPKDHTFDQSYYIEFGQAEYYTELENKQSSSKDLLTNS